MKGYLPGPAASSPVSGMLSFQSLDTLASASLANAARECRGQACQWYQTSDTSGCVIEISADEREAWNFSEPPAVDIWWSICVRMPATPVYHQSYLGLIDGIHEI